MARSILLTGFVALALVTCALAMTFRGVAGNEPVYRLDAAYHQLPPKLVAELLAHPPTRTWLSPRAKCQFTQGDEGPPVGYCICFGADACSNMFFPHHGGDETWRCNAPLGAIDDKGTIVCRADCIAQ